MKLWRIFLNAQPKRNSRTLTWFLRRLALVLALAAAIVAIIEAVAILYSIAGSGFGPYIDGKGEVVPAKTLWDWLDLLIVPLILAIGGITINSTIQRSQRRQAERRAKVDREIADDRLKEQALQTYLDRMSELLLAAQFDNPEVGDAAKTVARARTLTVLRGLDGGRRAAVLRFLYESKLIEGTTATIDLSEADFSQAHLAFARLEGANLEGVYLVGADLCGAHLERAHLERAHLEYADLVAAHLEGANLKSVPYTPNQLRHAILDENTILPDGSHYKPPTLSSAPITPPQPPTPQTPADGSAIQQKSS